MGDASASDHDPLLLASSFPPSTSYPAPRNAIRRLESKIERLAQRLVGIAFKKGRAVAEGGRKMSDMLEGERVGGYVRQEADNLNREH